MEAFSAPDWERMLRLDVPLLEIFIRGTAIYIALFVTMRLLKRQAGGLGLGDFLIVVMIADASQNAMAGTYESITSGLLLIATLMFWNVFLEWLSYHLPWFAKLTDAKPLQLVKNGRIHTANMRSELITREELMTQLRLQGVDAVSKVKSACMESDGKISVIVFNPARATPPPRKK